MVASSAKLMLCRYMARRPTASALETDIAHLSMSCHEALLFPGAHTRTDDAAIISPQRWSA